MTIMVLMTLMGLAVKDAAHGDIDLCEAVPACATSIRGEALEGVSDRAEDNLREVSAICGDRARGKGCTEDNEARWGDIMRGGS